MTYEQRKAFAEMHNSRGASPMELGSALGVHLATVYRELKRGGAEEQGVYDPDKAERTIRDNFRKRGPQRRGPACLPAGRSCGWCMTETP